ncbi:MAG: uncharacterized protein A8A55_0837 [Amphiamblys sp. WSBS2006]|nr:MAG: uncharacterized protein A8A55_0837 [Amphiamblys sp. WSBS2006]
MKILSVLLAALSVRTSTFDCDFAHVSEKLLPQFQTEKERDVYILDEKTSPNRLCSVLFTPVAKNKTVPSPVSPLRFVYDETEAKKHCQEARDIAGEVARFLAEHATVDTQAGTVRVASQNTQTVFKITEQKLFFVSFKNGELSVQEVPEGIAEVSVLGPQKNNIDYLYKKEKEHGNLFDSFLIAEECKHEDRWKTPRIRSIPRKRKEAALLLSFFAEKESQLDLEVAKEIHEEEGNKTYLKIPYGINLFVSEENSCCLKLFDLTDTKIKKLIVSSFDITRMDLKNTSIEELFLFDEAAVVFFYDSIGRSELCVEKLSFGSKSKPQSEKVLKLIERVHMGDNVTPRKIKRLVLGRGNFFDFLEEANRATQKEIHVEDLFVTQKGKDSGPKEGTRIVVSKKINVKENACVLRFIELGPEISHLEVDEIQRLCRSPEINIPRINIQMTKNKIIIRESLYALQFLKKNITATEVCFFGNKRKNELLNTKKRPSLSLLNTKITFAAEELESIWFRNQGLSVLSSITNKKIIVRHMKVMDTVDCFSNEEKEEARKKEFVIRERLYMRNTGILFMELLGNTVFIPVIEIEVDFYTEDWGRFEETIGVHIETNALLEKISPGIKDARKIKQNIGEMITQKESVVKAFSRYQKLLFEEDIEYEEQHELRESEEQPIAECQEYEEIKEDIEYEEQPEPRGSKEKPIPKSQWRGEIGMDACRYWFSRHLTEFYED